MPTITEFRVPAHDTALGTTFEEVPSLVCEMEPVIAADNLGMWASEADLSLVNSALEADSTVVTCSIIERDSNRWLYNIEFSDEITEVFSVVVKEEGTLLTATAKNGVWSIRLRFPARENASQAYERLSKQNISVDITKIHPFSKTTADEIGLTPEQYEALTAAIKYGYFQIPRDISMQDLAAEMDISHQALSERLRRAYSTLATTKVEIDKVDENM